jgi:hypothetical protein
VTIDGDAAIQRSTGMSSMMCIALREAAAVGPRNILRGMAAMVCGLRCDDNNRLVPLEGAAA